VADLEAEALLEVALVVAALVVDLEAEALEVEVPQEAGKLTEKQFLTCIDLRATR
jgi:hypothetical protein